MKPSANTQHSYNAALVHLWETKDVKVQKTETGEYILPRSIQFAEMLVQSLREIYGDEIHTRGKQYLNDAKAHRAFVNFFVGALAMNRTARLDYIADQLEEKTLAHACLTTLTPIIGVGHSADDCGFNFNGDTRDRHYIRVWEAMHTNNEKLLAKMCFDGEYCSLLPFMLTAFQLQWAVERGDTVRIEWITKGLQNDANRVSS